MAVYTQLNEKIERISKWIYLAVLVVSIGGVGLFTILLSYINYFIFDMEDDSFIVPIPLM